MKAIVNQSGLCPYCVSNNYDVNLIEERHVSQDKMKCINCNRWSIRCKRTNFQFPIQDPNDKDSSLSTVVEYA